MKTLEIEDDGFTQVTIGAVERTVDVFDVYHRLLEFRSEVDNLFPDGAPSTHTREYNARVARLLAEDLGFGPVSHRAANAFALAVFDAVDALGKATGPEPTPA